MENFNCLENRQNFYNKLFDYSSAYLQSANYLYLRNVGICWFWIKIARIQDEELLPEILYIHDFNLSTN